GDANGDRAVNDRDLFEVWQSSMLPIQKQNLNDDLNGDGQVTVTDLDIVRTNFLRVLPSITVQILGSQVNGGDAQHSRLELITVRFSENVGASLSLADL